MGIATLAKSNDNKISHLFVLNHTDWEIISCQFQRSMNISCTYSNITELDHQHSTARCMPGVHVALWG